MELSELNEIWKSSDEKLDKSLALNKKLLHEVTAGTIRKNLSGIKWDCYIEIVLSYLFFDALAGFTAEVYQEIKYLVPAIFLMIFAVSGIIFGIYKLILFFSIKPETSVIQTQKYAGKLGYLERLEINMLYWIIPFFWTAFIIVTSKALADFDDYSEGSFLIYQAIASFVIGVIIIFFLKKFPDKKLRETINFLKELEQNED